MKAINSLKLVAKDSVDLDRLSYSAGDLVYDVTNNTIRIMDGINQGGKKIATQAWVSSTLTAGLVPYATTTSVTTALASYVTTANLTSTLASYDTIAARTAAISAAAYTLPTSSTSTLGGVKVDGTTITINNGTISATNQVASSSFYNNAIYNTTGIVVKNAQLTASASVVLPANNSNNAVQINNTAGDITLVSNQKTWTFNTDGTLTLNNGLGEIFADPNDNAVYISDLGHASAPNTNIRIGGASTLVQITSGPVPTHIWAFNVDGSLDTAGDITSPSTVTASAVTTTNDVTVGGNANISTKPTLPVHATNKKYVDTRSLALSIAMS